MKSTAIDKTVIDEDGVYRKIGPARIFISEADAIKAVKDKGLKMGLRLEILW